MTTPATEGPITRAALTTTLLRVTALARSAGPTISITKVWRLGLSTAVTSPNPAARAYTIHNRTVSVRVRTPSVRASVPATVWVPMISVRLSTRSAINPPTVPNNSVGRNCMAMTVPRAVPLPVSSSTSHDSATDCIHVPENETI